jgi:hypothetical protein
MSILIHLVDGSPARVSGETHAGLILARDEQLGWRCKLTAMPTKRELMRSVSDCPLTIAENILLWSKRHGWQIKLHPNSVSLKELLSTVKSYTDLGQPETNILAGAMLLKNFCPPHIQQVPGLPDFTSMLVSLQQQQQQAPPQPQTEAQTEPQPPQPPSQPQATRHPNHPEQQYVGAGAAKMKRTHEKYDQHMAQVNATLEANAQKEANDKAKMELGKKIAENFDQEMAELDQLLADELQEEVVVPESFKNKESAIAWSIELGAYDDKKEAEESWVELHSESGGMNIKRNTKVGKENFLKFSKLWIESVCTVIGAEIA